MGALRRLAARIPARMMLISSGLSTKPPAAILRAEIRLQVGGTSRVRFMGSLVAISY